MLGFRNDEPAFPFDASASLASPPTFASTQNMEYKSNSPLDHAGHRNSSFSSNSPPSTSKQNRGSMDSGCVREMNSQGEAIRRATPEMGLLAMGSQGLSLDAPSPLLAIKADNGGILRQYVEDYGEALLAFMKGDYVKGSLSNQVSSVGNARQASMVASPSRTEDSLLRFLPSNYEQYTVDCFSCDEFRMNEFKVRRCMRGRSHDWTECPFAHPGEKARRRDPRRFHYSSTACPDFRRGTCKRGDACELSHGVFECWLHPDRYRTQLCKDGKFCKRRVCFFAHSTSQLRVVSPQPVPTSRSGSISKSPFPSFSDNAWKQLQHGVSHSKLAPSDSYFTEGLLEDFSPKSMHSFPDDRFSDVTSPITNHSFILNNTHKHLNDGRFESSCQRNWYGNGLSEDGKSDKPEFNSVHGDHHNYILSSDDGNFMCKNSHVYSDFLSHSLSTGEISFDGLCDNSMSKNSQAHVNLRTQLALASLSSKFEQIISPTSTLARHAFSPPLSPSDSPPMSPSMVFPTCNGMSRRMATLYGQASSYDAPLAGTSINTSQNNGHPASTASLLVQNNGAAMFANTRGPSPLSTSSVGDDPESVDMLGAMPSRHKVKEQRVETGLQESQSTQAIAHLCSAYQQIADMNNQRPALPLNGISESRREANWEENPDAENPDLGWVNDLVT